LTVSGSISGELENHHKEAGGELNLHHPTLAITHVDEGLVEQMPDAV
jgi:hypothetical protein